MSTSDAWWREVYRDLGRVDEATYEAISATPTPALDASLRRLSRSADRSMLWVAVAAGLAALGGDGGRRAARDGLLSVAMTSGIVNLGLKPLHRRRRPDDTRVRTVPGRSVRMPRSASFPFWPLGVRLRLCDRCRFGDSAAGVATPPAGGGCGLLEGARRSALSR